MSQFPDAHFILSANAPAQFLPDRGSEVAVAGRSNAGKSSAINVIVNRRQFARTSKTPGRTQLVNFFELRPDQRLVDLPGYGFARVSDKVRDHWGRLLQEYFESRESLTGLARNRRGLVLGRGQRPPGCTTLITAEMDAILARRRGDCNHQVCLMARDYFAPFRQLRGLPFSINDFIPCTRVQAACQGFVARAAQWAQRDHQNREGYWAAGTSGHPWAFAERQLIVAEHGVVGRSAVPNYPTTPQTPSGP